MHLGQADHSVIALAPTVRGMFDQTERWEMGRQATVEAEGLKQIKAGKEADAISLPLIFVKPACHERRKDCT